MHYFLMNLIMNCIHMIKLEKYFITAKNNNWQKLSMRNLWMVNQCQKKTKLDRQ